MALLISWVIALAISIFVLVVTAGGERYYINAAVAAAVALTIAVLSIRANRSAVAGGAEAHEIARLNASYMAVVWSWGAAAVAAIYATVLVWNEWWHFVLAFGVAMVLCLGFTRMLKTGSEGGTVSPGLLKTARYATMLQLAGMVITMVGLVVDGKMDFGYVDWAGNNVFFAGAAALAIMSWSALDAQKQVQGRQVA